MVLAARVHRQVEQVLALRQVRVQCRPVDQVAVHVARSLVPVYHGSVAIDAVLYPPVPARHRLLPHVGARGEKVSEALQRPGIPLFVQLVHDHLEAHQRLVHGDAADAVQVLHVQGHEGRLEQLGGVLQVLQHLLRVADVGATVSRRPLVVHHDRGDVRRHLEALGLIYDRALGGLGALDPAHPNPDGTIRVPLDVVDGLVVHHLARPDVQLEENRLGIGAHPLQDLAEEHRLRMALGADDERIVLHTVGDYGPSQRVLVAGELKVGVDAAPVPEARVKAVLHVELEKLHRAGHE